MNLKLLRDPDAEARLIAGCLLTNACLPEALDLVRAGDMSSAALAAVWEAVRAVHARGEDVQHETLHAELVARGKLAAAGGDAALLSLTDRLVGAGQVPPLAKHIRRVALVRSHQERMMRLLAESQEPIEDLESFADRIESAFTNNDDRMLTGDPVSMHDLMTDVIASVSAQREGGQTLGYQSGLIALDYVLGGFVPSEQTVLAGRPGMGKSALAQRIALGVEQSSKKPVLVVSREMSKLLFGRRVAAADARVDGNRLRSGKLNREDWDSLIASAERLSGRRIYVVDSKTCKTMLDVRRAARRVVDLAKADLAMIVIDYAQLMNTHENHANREQEVAAISSDSVQLAKDFNAHSLLLAQVNRECEKGQDKRPQLSHLRESAALEHDADNALFVYRDEVYNAESQDKGIAEIIIAKQRSGPTGTVKTRFVAEHTSFENLQYEDTSYANA